MHPITDLDILEPTSSARDHALGEDAPRTLASTWGPKDGGSRVYVETYG